ncbi:ArsR/SmtB family transcription factor [Blastochloris sulfoviridis]|uniref:Helix-turn-helix transcriptional regulator n=1 Tax=Blastochloris sulfoviridis TaxID=50712 RepID=A0A5M6HK42_9HYPH|nr:metalloregulator ArsR/SmtB family transcription factor [Blastochloris sulfoviridis]KAA5596240.1 helix-turn-helix transcriptional regulator [Blastochloris sulfoviridis]
MAAHPTAPSRVSRLLVARRRVDIAELLSYARDASELLKALSHESRLVILCLLAEGDKSVSELAEILDQRQPAVSQQLARLKSDRLVQARREGTHIYYSLAREEVRDVILALHAAFCGPARAPEVDDPGI